jgi:shikimate 5-dehydrogenase
MLLYCQELHMLGNNFDGLKYMHILQRKNEITDELAKLSSSRAKVPTWVFLQELHEPSILRALVEATKVAESSQETPPPNESITESPEVMEVQSDWHTPLMLYLRIGVMPENKVECEQLH